METTHHILGNLCPVTLTAKNVFLHVYLEPSGCNFVTFGFCSVSEYHQKEPGYLFCLPSYQGFEHIAEFPISPSLLFSVLNSPLSSHERPSSPLIIPVALCDTISTSFIYSIALASSERDRCPDVASSELNRGSSPSTCW